MGCAKEEHAAGLRQRGASCGAVPKRSIMRGCAREEHAVGLCQEEHVDGLCQEKHAAELCQRGAC